MKLAAKSGGLLICKQYYPQQSMSLAALPEPVEHKSLSVSRRAKQLQRAQIR
jgi:hypothetical protein